MSRPKLDEIDKKIQQLQAQKQAILNSEKEKERKGRTKRLIEIGAIVEKNESVLKEKELQSKNQRAQDENMEPN